MNRAISLLENSGFKVLGLNGDYLVLEDPSCFVRSIESFMDYAWIAITAVAAMLLFGWGISFIRGAKTNMVVNLRNLTLIFGALAVTKPAVNLIWGDDMFNAACRQISVPVSEIYRILDARQAKLKSKSADDFFEEFDIWDSASGDEYSVDMMAAELNRMAELGIPDSGDTQRLSGIIVSGGRARGGAYGSSSARLNPKSVAGRAVYKIENSLPQSELSIAQSVIDQYGLSIRGMGRAGDGHLGAGRKCDSRISQKCSGGRRDHLGTDLYFHGREPSPGTPVPSLYDGRVIKTGQVYKNDASLHMVLIQNDNGTTTRMLYLRGGVNVGDRVRAGQIVGYSENLHRHYGSDTPQHVHFELRKNGQIIDPESLF